MLEEPSPVKVDGYRCHVLDTKVDLYLARQLPAYVYIAWKNGFKLLTLST